MFFWKGEIIEITRYNKYSEHLLESYGHKVYKIPINLPGTCPNRDGSISFGGCIYCDEEGSGFESLPSSMEVGQQVKENIKFFAERYKAQKFIIYFQSFTNTYQPLDKFKSYINASLVDDNIIGISVSTRPDCVDEVYLDFLEEISKKKSLNIDIELGLQTANYHTLDKINRGHTLGEFIDSVKRIKRRNFFICAHLILNLPWDNKKDVMESAKIISALEVEYVKLHSLYIVDGTELGEMFKKGDIEVIGLEEYVDRVVTFLEYLSPYVVIQRLVARGPRHKLLFGNWGASWWKIKELIEEELKKRDTWQGKKASYLEGQV